MKFTDNMRVLTEKISPFNSSNNETLPNSFFDRRKEIKQMRTHLDELCAGLRKWVQCESQWVSSISKLHSSVAVKDIYSNFCKGNAVAVTTVEKAQLSLSLKKKYIRSMLTRCDQVEALFLLKNRAERKLVNIKAKENANEWKVHKAQARFEAAKRSFDVELERLNNDIDFLFSYAGESAFGASEIKLFTTMQQDFFNRCATCVETEFTPFEYDVNDFVVFDTCRVANLFPESVDKSESDVPIETPGCNVDDSVVANDENADSDETSPTESVEPEFISETPEPKVSNVESQETEQPVETESYKTDRHVTFDISTRFLPKGLLVRDDPQEDHSGVLLQKIVNVLKIKNNKSFSLFFKKFN